MKICSFDGCGRKHKARGLCAQHNRQKLQKKVLTPIRPWKINTPACSIELCNSKPIAKDLCRYHYFHFYISMADDKICVSPGCDRLRINGKTIRRYCQQCQYLSQRHGISLEIAQKLWAGQGNSCANCSKAGPIIYVPCNEWPIDHDHSCCPGRGCGKCVRGIVCHQCNTGPLTTHVTKEVWEATGRYLGYV